MLIRYFAMVSFLKLYQGVFGVLGFQDGVRIIQKNLSHFGVYLIEKLPHINIKAHTPRKGKVKRWGQRFKKHLPLRL